MGCAMPGSTAQVIAEQDLPDYDHAIVEPMAYVD
jgi:hypothetical protein